MTDTYLGWEDLKTRATDWRALWALSEILGFLTAWWPQGNQASYGGLRAQSMSVPVNEAEAASPFYDLTSEVTQHHLFAFYWLEASTMISPDSRGGNRDPRLSMGGMSKDLWTSFKPSTVYPFVKNYFHYSDIQNILTPTQDAPKSHPLMSSGSGLWSRISSCKSV